MPEAEKYLKTYTGSKSMMRQLAKMASIPEGGFRRMILLLDIDDVPRLFTEGLIRAEPNFNPGDLEEGGPHAPIIVETMDIKDIRWRE